MYYLTRIDSLPVRYWYPPKPVYAISSAPCGGGLGWRNWVVNATVPADYNRKDPEVHLEGIARRLGLYGFGIGMLTAVDVGQRAVFSEDDGVAGSATVGLGNPTWAAAPDGDLRSLKVGTINIMIQLPVMMTDAALVNAVATATEAKVQALLDCGVEATGTATDGLAILCAPSVIGGNPQTFEKFGGPRSTWGARIARAVHSAVKTGSKIWMAEQSLERLTK